MNQCLFSCFQGTTLSGRQDERLTTGSSLISSDKCFKLVHQEDGNLVLYHQTTGKALWSTGTIGGARMISRITKCQKLESPFSFFFSFSS